MKYKKVALTSLALCGLAISLNADIIKFNGVSDGSVEYVSIVGNSLPINNSSNTGTYTGGVYTGLYNITDLTTNQSWKSFCIDPIGDIQSGNQWNANLVNGAMLATGNAGVLSNPCYANGLSSSITSDKYQMIGYLVNKYYYNPTNLNALGVSGRSDLSLAFWEIARDFNGQQSSLNLSAGNFRLTSGNLSVAQGFITDAYSAFSQGLTNNISMSVYSPTARPSQEFIAFKVPEPAAISLLGIGLTILGFAFRRNRRNR